LYVSSHKKYFPSHTPPSQSSSNLDYPHSPSLSPGIVEVMRAEMNAMKSKLTELEKEYEENAGAAQELYKKCKVELVALKEKSGMDKTAATEEVEATYPSSGFLPALVPVSPSLGGTTSLLALAMSGGSSGGMNSSGVGSGGAASWSLERSRERSRGPSASRSSTGAHNGGSLTDLNLGSSVFSTSSGRGEKFVNFLFCFKLRCDFGH
jgi:hypothetical protein